MTQLNVIDVIDPAGVLSGEPYRVLCVAGKAVLIPARELDGMVHAAVPVAPAVVEPVVTRPALTVDRKKPGRKPKTPVAPVAVAPEVPEKPCKGEVQERAIEILRVHGPLTTAEFAEHLYPDVDRVTRVQRVHGSVQALRERGLVDKRDDPNAGGISKWFLVEGK